MLWIDTKAQSEPDINNHYYAAASKATVYDDKGKPITEEEIKAYMISDYQPGCCLLGGCVGSGASFLLGCAAAIYLDETFDEDIGWKVFWPIWGVGTVVSALIGYEFGEEIDRRKAIELIKEERRTGKKPPQLKRKFLPKVGGYLGAVSASILIIGIVGTAGLSNIDADDVYITFGKRLRIPFETLEPHLGMGAGLHVLCLGVKEPLRFFLSPMINRRRGSYMVRGSALLSTSARHTKSQIR